MVLFMFLPGLLGVTLVVGAMLPQRSTTVASPERAQREALVAAAGRSLVLAGRQQELTITVPGARNLGAGTVGSTIGGQLGPVTVEDHRPANPNTWVVRVSSTSYTTGAGGPAETIANARVFYWSGPATRSIGGGTLVPGQPTAAQAQSLGVTRVAFAKTGGNGANMVTWNPRVSVVIPTGVVSGLYAGRITHSVA